LWVCWRLTVKRGDRVRGPVPSGSVMASLPGCQTAFRVANTPVVARLGASDIYLRHTSDMACLPTHTWGPSSGCRSKMDSFHCTPPSSGATNATHETNCDPIAPHPKGGGAGPVAVCRHTCNSHFGLLIVQGILTAAFEPVAPASGSRRPASRARLAGNVDQARQRAETERKENGRTARDLSSRRTASPAGPAGRGREQ
jgi:hypothetical protein